MENSRKNIYITIFVITTVLASCFAVYFAIEASNNAPQNITTGKVESVATDDVKKSETKVEIKEVEKGVFPQVDTNKCINKTEGIKYMNSLERRFRHGDIYCSLNEDNKSIILTCEPEVLKEYYNIDKGNTYVNINIDGFATEIVDILCCSSGGQVAGREVILLLMADGTVEYIPLAKALKDNNTKSYGKIENVSNIVRIDTMSFVDQSGGGAASGPIAIKADGSFYDLMSMLTDKF